MNQSTATKSTEQTVHQLAGQLIEVRDFTAAIDLLTPYENGDNPHLIFSLNFAYAMRRQPGDRRKSRALLERAASLGHAKAELMVKRSNISRRLIIKPTRSTTLDISNNIVILKDAIETYLPEEIVKCIDLSKIDSDTLCQYLLPALQAHAQKRDVIASRILAHIYIHVYGGVDHYDEAVALLNDSIDAGCSASACALAQIYRKGLGGPINLELAFEAAELGMALGNQECRFQVGNALFNGLGVAKDIPRAIQVLQEASDRGHAYAPSMLARIMMKGEHAAYDEAKIIELLKLSASRYCGLGASFLAAFLSKNSHCCTHECEPAAYAMLANELGESGQDYRIAALSAQDLPKVCATFKAIKAEFNQKHN